MVVKSKILYEANEREVRNCVTRVLVAFGVTIRAAYSDYCTCRNVNGTMEQRHSIISDSFNDLYPYYGRLFSNESLDCPIGVIGN